MTHRFALTAGAVALALLATPISAETTDLHEAFHAWRGYCFDAGRPRNEAAAQYCAGLRSAAGLRPQGAVSGLDAALSLALATGAGPATSGTTDATVAPWNPPRRGPEGDLVAGVPRGGR